MIEVHAIIYYILVLNLVLMSRIYYIKYFDNKKNRIISECDKQKIKQIKGERPWRTFEKEIANLFEIKGWKVNLGPGEADEGKDIVIMKDGNYYLVQCKHRFGARIVTPKEIRDFQGAVDLYNKKYNKNAKGIFITSGKTTEKARETAYSLGINLWDKYNWERRIQTF